MSECGTIGIAVEMGEFIAAFAFALDFANINVNTSKIIHLEFQYLVKRKEIKTLKSLSSS